MQFELTVEGVPVAKARPRLSGCRVYTPRKTVLHEQHIKDCWDSKYGNIIPTGKPLEVVIKFYMPMPRSVSKKLREPLLTGVMHTVKPDIDNLIKMVLDALNKVAYEDDKQIVDIYAYKRYSEQPRTEITITEKW